MKWFKICVIDIFCTVRGDPDEYLNFAISLHQKAAIYIRKKNKELDLAFLYVNVRSKSNLTYWYQNPTDTGQILCFRSSALLQHLKKCDLRNGSQIL